MDSINQLISLNPQQHTVAGESSAPDSPTTPKILSPPALDQPPDLPAQRYSILPRHRSATPIDAPPPAGDPTDPRPAVLRYLALAGVWTDVAQRIAEQIAENQRRPYDQYLPGLGDVLGWIAYCFADREKNKLSNSAAVLAANLHTNRCCPPEYRPPAVCRRCACLESCCECTGPPTLYFPDEFLAAALRTAPYDIDHDRWGVCHYCRSFPCQCEMEDAP